MPKVRHRWSILSAVEYSGHPEVHAAHFTDEETNAQRSQVSCGIHTARASTCPDLVRHWSPCCHGNLSGAAECSPQSAAVSSAPGERRPDHSSWSFASHSHFPSISPFMLLCPLRLLFPPIRPHVQGISVLHQTLLRTDSVTSRGLLKSGIKVL